MSAPPPGPPGGPPGGPYQNYGPPQQQGYGPPQQQGYGPPQGYGQGPPPPQGGPPQKEGMSLKKKILIGVAGTFVLIFGGMGYLWYNDMRVSDFFASPEGILDSAIYSAQEAKKICSKDPSSEDCKDAIEDFQRWFTRDSVIKIQEMHDRNTELIGTAQYDPVIHWTWPSVIETWSKLGGFEIEEEEDIWDRMGEPDTRLTVTFGEKRKKVVKFIKKSEVWQIDLAVGAEYDRARRATQYPAYPGGDPNNPGGAPVY